MNFERTGLAKAYRRLLGFYPRLFRERFGESMVQTFEDVCRERETANRRLDAAFVISVFADTAVGVAVENLRELNGVVIESLRLRVFVSVAGGLLVTAPFVVLEWVYSGGFPQGVPFAIFNVLFIEATLFTFLVLSLLRTPCRNPLSAWIGPFALKLLLAIPLALSWTHIVSDQMPCFFGGRGC